MPAVSPAMAFYYWYPGLHLYQHCPLLPRSGIFPKAAFHLAGVVSYLSHPRLRLPSPTLPTMIESTDIMLDKYYISSNGFLPTGLPLQKLPSIYYAPWENLAADLPNLIKTGQIRDRIDALPTLSTKLLENEEEWRRACVIMGFLTHAYIWGGEKPRDVSNDILAL